MRLLLASALIATLALGMISCRGKHDRRASGTGASHQSGTAASAPASPYLNDGDRDPTSDEDGDESNGNKADTDHDYSDDHRPEDSASYHDYDDDTASFGSPANEVDTRAVTRLVKRYRHAAARHDGAKACALMYPPLTEELTEGYEQSGPSYVRGLKSCRAILTALFKHTLRRHLVATFVVTQVRVDQNRAVALLGSRTMPASYLRAHRERGVWTVDSLLDTPMG